MAPRSNPRSNRSDDAGITGNGTCGFRAIPHQQPRWYVIRAHRSGEHRGANLAIGLGEPAAHGCRLTVDERIARGVLLDQGDEDTPSKLDLLLRLTASQLSLVQPLLENLGSLKTDPKVRSKASNELVSSIWSGFRARGIECANSIPRSYPSRSFQS
jgi:hypothetical protein